MEEMYFNTEDLELCDWQYQITHHTINDFKIGESVFLKSNPDYPMTVIEFTENTIITSCCSINEDFSPECLLQYEYAGLVIWKRKYNISKN